MSSRSSSRWAVLGGLLALAVLVTGCAPATVGPDVIAAASRVGAATDWVVAASSETLPSTAPAVADSTWSAVVEPVSGQGIVSPSGDLTATLIGDRVCFAPMGGVGQCASLASGSTPVFAAFSPDGSRLLVITDLDDVDGAYVLDPVDASVHVLGPDGVQAYAPDSIPPPWDLSTAAWNAGGTGVLLVPRTNESTGPVLEIGLSGPATEVLRLDALLANSSPSIWSSVSGLAVVGNIGDGRNVLWWADFATGTTSQLLADPDPSVQVVLGSADPLGRWVLACQRRADGSIGAATMVQVSSRAVSVPPTVLPNPTSCPGSVFSADGTYLALTTEIDGRYTLVVTDVEKGQPVLTAPLDLPAPSVPPYLTWFDDVIVATDVGGRWPSPSAIVRLDR